MTWATSSIGRSLSTTGVFLKKQIWVWPILAVVILSVVGFSVRSAVESTMKNNLRSELETLLGVETAMLENWFEVQSSNAETLANDLQIRQVLYQLLDFAPDDAAAEGDASREQLLDRLAAEIAAATASHDYVGYLVVDKSQRIVTASSAALIGQQEISEYTSFLGRALDGEVTVSAPFASIAMMKSHSGRMRAGQPTMYVCAPVRDTNFQVIAALALQIRPEQEFTRILQLGRIGESGETYAFDATGRMVSNSRFDEDLILLGLLPDQEDTRSILNLLVRDPLGDMTAGFRPNQRRAKLPLTRMAADAIAGNAHVDVEGYRDYRGVPVVGAWTWLDDYDIGVTTEVDVAEAFRPLTILQWAF